MIVVNWFSLTLQQLANALGLYTVSLAGSSRPSHSNLCLLSCLLSSFPTQTRQFPVPLYSALPGWLVLFAWLVLFPHPLFLICLKSLNIQLKAASFTDTNLIPPKSNVFLFGTWSLSCVSFSTFFFFLF